MKEIKIGNYALTFEQALVELTTVKTFEFEAQNKPNIQSMKRWILKEGPKAFKVAILWTIRDAHTLKEHHHELTINTLRRHKAKDQWIIDDEHSIQLSDENEDEIGELLRGLAGVFNKETQSDYIIIDLKSQDDNKVRQILDAIALSGRKIELISEVLSWSDNDPNVTSGLMKLASDHPIRSKSLAAGLNYGRYKRALDEFKVAIEANHQESFYQDFLEKEYWMFGSEYCELLPNRSIVKGMILDFPLRRTVDGYLDIIEIKRPHERNLFRKDGRGNLSPTAELTEAISQADAYLSNIDADQYQIKVHEYLEAEKVRAKIVIGRDGTDEELRALRRLNARTNRIEVITFDQLAKLAERILEILGDEASLQSVTSVDSSSRDVSPPKNFGDIPF